MGHIVIIYVSVTHGSRAITTRASICYANCSKWRLGTNWLQSFEAGCGAVMKNMNFAWKRHEWNGSRYKRHTRRCAGISYVSDCSEHWHLGIPVWICHFPWVFMHRRDLITFLIIFGWGQCERQPSMRLCVYTLEYNYSFYLYRIELKQWLLLQLEPGLCDY